MDVNLALNTIIRPTLELMGWKYTGPRAELQLTTIALQESRFQHRKQIGGPARSYWQGELTGGMILVMGHPSTKDKARELCQFWDIPFNRNDVYEAIAWHDPLACCLARLLLWTVPKALPEIGDVKGAWDYYHDAWRPGRPKRETWDGLYAEARSYVGV